MPKRSESERGSVRLDYCDELSGSLRQLKEYYGISSAKDLVRFLILQEHRRLFEKQGQSATE